MRKTFPPLVLGTGAALVLMTGLVISHGSTSTPLIRAAHADDVKPDDSPEKAIVFLEKYCSGCHGQGKRLSKKAWIDRKAYQNIVETQRLVIPGKPEESELYTSMLRDRGVMPPPNAPARPTKEETDVIKTWIANGAKPWAETAPEAPAAP